MIVFNQFVPFCAIRLRRTDGFLSTETVGRLAGRPVFTHRSARRKKQKVTKKWQPNEEAIEPPKIELLEASEGFQTSSVRFCNLFNILSNPFPLPSTAKDYLKLLKFNPSANHCTVCFSVSWVLMFRGDLCWSTKKPHRSRPIVVFSWMRDVCVQTAVTLDTTTLSGGRRGGSGGTNCSITREIFKCCIV